ncbi:cryptochrome/photolyase family protein [Shimia aestuarii]|uniref:cryptochrome/photolyase family protein n=1 Tax=Shimia aestuarii TaxID=254406 RepID=UPI001FB34229|nr:deoxyribodipyrimidine photo-lyase [Shimia aestuarii]
MTVSIHWFRRDLRLSDNPALSYAAKRGALLPVYILEEADAPGGATRAWLHRSLEALNAALTGALHVYRGDPAEILPRLAETHGAETLTWNRRYDARGMDCDTALKTELRTRGLNVHSANGALLWEPMDVNKADGTPYRVFSPFFRKGCAAAAPPREPLPAPSIALLDVPNDTALDDLALRPTPAWDEDVLADWTPGEAGATARLEAFLEEGLSGYKEGRDIPSAPHVSRLSPHLAFGEISPNTVWYGAKAQPASRDRDHFLSELGWREFSYNLLFHNPDMDWQNLNRKFDGFPWRDAPDLLTAWQKGQTGIPIVDAGMRELWQTGYMHNRVRMIVASFLVKNLRVHWRHGLAWFHDTLFDADPANNPASWQWVAGSGADAAPYFRIFNPVTQSAKFDAEGAYLRRYVPELARLPDKHLHAPWEAPAEVLRGAGIVLGTDYPHPIADLRESRQGALSAYDQIKGSPS